MFDSLTYLREFHANKVKLPQFAWTKWKSFQSLMAADLALLYLRGALTRLSSIANVDTDCTKKANIVLGTCLARCSSDGWLHPIHSIRPLTDTRPGISSKTKMQLWLEDNLALDICTLLDADIWKGLLGKVFFGLTKNVRRYIWI